jgi:hypothetical protein
VWYVAACILFGLSPRCEIDQYRLCTQCDIQIHSNRVTAGHKRIPIAEHEKVRVILNLKVWSHFENLMHALPKCPKHANYDMDHYCVNCSVAVCPVCALGMDCY